MNGQIRISPVRVIDQHQTQLGVIPLVDAMNLAREADMDLVEVSPTERPPVCRVMDYGKFKYEKKKRQKLAAGSHVVLLKEIRMRPKTDPHDLAIKLNRAKAFLAEGHKVQFTMLFRGRERAHRDRATLAFRNILEELGDTVRIDRQPISEGRRMTMLVSPVRRQVQPKKQSPSQDQGSKPVSTATTEAPEKDLSPAES